MKTISEITIETDRMSGLRLKGISVQQKPEVFSVIGWDEKDKNNVLGLLNEEELELLNHEFVAANFKRFDEGGNPIPYSRRLGDLGRPKTVGFIRLLTDNGIDFILSLHERGGNQVASLKKLRLKEKMNMTIRTSGGEKCFTIFDPALHSERINKILSSGN